MGGGGGGELRHTAERAESSVAVQQFSQKPVPRYLNTLYYNTFKIYVHIPIGSSTSLGYDPWLQRRKQSTEQMIITVTNHSKGVKTCVNIEIASHGKYGGVTVSVPTCLWWSEGIQCVTEGARDMKGTEKARVVSNLASEGVLVCWWGKKWVSFTKLHFCKVSSKVDYIHIQRENVRRCEPGISVDSLRAGRSGDPIHVRVRFSASFHTGLAAHPASYKTGTGSLPCG